MNYGHVLGFIASLGSIACVGVIEMMLWAVSYEMLGMSGHPLVAILNGILFFLTLPIWIVYWVVCLGRWTVEGFGKGISREIV